jgi:hypothetical protein
MQATPPDIHTHTHARALRTPTSHARSPHCSSVSIDIDVFVRVFVLAVTRALHVSNYAAQSYDSTHERACVIDDTQRHTRQERSARAQSDRTHATSPALTCCASAAVARDCGISPPHKNKLRRNITPDAHTRRTNVEIRARSARRHQLSRFRNYTHHATRPVCVPVRRARARAHAISTHASPAIHPDHTQSCTARDTPCVPTTSPGGCHARR